MLVGPSSSRRCGSLWAKLVACTALCVAVDGLSQAGQGHASLGIVNGTVVENPIDHYSFFALLTQGPKSDQWLGCGASIISPTFALSSAHCFGGGKLPCSGPSQLAIWAGELSLHPDGTISPKSKHAKTFRAEVELQCHAKFDGKCSHGHDLALLRLKQALPSWLRPAVVDLHASQSTRVGQPVSIVGHGLVESVNDRTLIADASTVLRKVTVNVLADSSASCSRVYAGGYGCSDEFSEGAVSNIAQQLCAGAVDQPERDTCAGDSGSPMVNAAGAQVGIVSYGGGPGSKNRGPGRSCGDPNFPGIYARLSGFADYLSAHVPDLHEGAAAATPPQAASLLRHEAGR